jgi:hypothetical protein
MYVLEVITRVHAKAVCAEKCARVHFLAVK